jgi:WhiB family transcriptional regulator, redox-sensing transcriptional regulator
MTTDGRIHVRRLTRTGDMAWLDHAECRDLDPAIFFPAQHANLGPALKVCRQCPVRTECLNHALGAPEPVGVWGGVSAKARGRM